MAAARDCPSIHYNAARRLRRFGIQTGGSMKKIYRLALLAIVMTVCASCTTYPDGSYTKAEYDAYLARRVADPDYEANHAALEARVAAENYCNWHYCGQ